MLIALAAFLAAPLSKGQDGPISDIFEVIGKSPGEVAASIPECRPLGKVDDMVKVFVGVPMSPTNRAEWMKQLRSLASPDKHGNRGVRRCLLNLLEEDGLFQDALTLINDGSDKDAYDLLKEGTLLWKAGRIQEAQEVFKRLDPNALDDEAWAALAEVDLITRQNERAAKLLDFMISQSDLPSQARYSLALQRLDLARRDGSADQLIDQTPTPVFKVVWHAALGRRTTARGIAADFAAGMTAPDLTLLLHALDPEPDLVNPAREWLSNPAITAHQQRSLLMRFDDTKLRFELWAGMRSGHAETIDVLDRYQNQPVTGQAPFQVPYTEQALASSKRLLDAQPAEPRLQLLMGVMDRSQPSQDNRYLLQAAQGFVIDPPEGSRFSDPAASALQELCDKVPASELFKLLDQAPGFKELPMRTRMTCFMAANLDEPILAMLPDFPFADPLHEHFSSKVCEYLRKRSGVYVIPENAVNTIIKRLPEIIVGSQEKKLSLIQSDASEWLHFLFRQAKDKAALTDSINRLMFRTESSLPSVREAVIAGIPSAVWGIPGIGDPGIQKPSQEEDYRVSDTFVYLGIFAPPEYLRTGIKRIKPQAGATPASGRPVFDNLDQTHLILTESPWSRSFRGFKDNAKRKSRIQSRLRLLMDSSPDRTLIYDLLATTGGIEVPDPQVKLCAEQRMAGLHEAPPLHPAAQVYAFFQYLTNGAPIEKAQEILGGLDRFLITDRRAVLNILESRLKLNPAWAFKPTPYEVVANAMNTGMDAPVVSAVPKPPELPEQISAYDRLQLFREAKRADSPESISLAKEVLWNFVRSGKSSTTPEENISVSTLSAAGKFGEFLEEVKTKLETGGASELEVQRAFYHLHLYRGLHSIKDLAPFAKRVFELDPTDMAAASDVSIVAAMEKNTDLAIRCFETLARHSRSKFLRLLAGNGDNFEEIPSVLSGFDKDSTRTLGEALLAIDLKPVSGNHYQATETEAKGLRNLYLQFAQNQMDQLLPIIRWSHGFHESNWPILLDFCQGLKTKEQDAVAIRILAEAYFSPPETKPDEQLRLKSRNPNIMPYAARLPLSSLRENGWLKPLAVAARSYPASPQTAGVRMLIALAADPTVATWGKESPAFLETIAMEHRSQVNRLVGGFLQQIPGSDNLLNHLASESLAAPDARITPDVIVGYIRLAAKTRNNSQVRKYWEMLQEYLAVASEQHASSLFTQTLLPLAVIADDEVWRNVLDAASKSPRSASGWTDFLQDEPHLDEISDRRMLDLFRLAEPYLKLQSHNRSFGTSLFERLAKSSEPDPEILSFFRPWLEMAKNPDSRGSGASPQQLLLELNSSSLDAATPVLRVRKEAEGKWIVDWSLAGFKGPDVGFPYDGMAKYLDGRFDLEILAGPDMNRLSKVADLPQASSTGQTNLSLPADAKFVGLMAKEREGRRVRSSHLVALDSAPSGKVLPISPIIPNEVGSSMIRSGQGPFRLDDAVEIEIMGDQVIDLAEIPWKSGRMPTISGWVSVLCGNPSLQLSFRAADGREIVRYPLTPDGALVKQLPFWQRFKIDEVRNSPSGAEKVVLVLAAVSAERPSKIRLADVRVETPPVLQLPQGFHLIGRIPARLQSIALDSLSNRFAASVPNLGLGVFDLDRGAFSGWIAIPPTQADKVVEIGWLGFAGDRLIFADSEDNMRVASVINQSIRVIGKIEGIYALTRETGRVKLSPDGKFIAMSGDMAGTWIFHIPEDGEMKMRLLETPRIDQLSFSKNSSVLEMGEGRDLHSLDLKEWETATLKTTTTSDDKPAVTNKISDRYFIHEALSDGSDNVNYHVSTKVDLEIKTNPDHRRVSLPSGIIALDQNRKPFFVSFDGGVIRIQTTEIPEFGAESD